MLSRAVLRASEAVRRRNGHAMPRTGPTIHRVVSRLLPDRADVELLPGIRAELDLRQPVELQSWWQGRRYEHPTTARLDEWAAQADAFFDVGANHGFFSLRAVHAGCPTVHAFEPNPVLHERLRTTAARNRLAGLHCHHLGLGDAPGDLTLHVRDEDLGHSSFGPRAWPDGREVVVPVTTFDAWRASVGVPLPDAPRWLAKIDVEGFELRALRGMAEALAAQAFLALVVELNELTLASCGATAAEVVDVLADAGYDLVEGAPANARVRNGCFVPRRA